MNSLAFVWAEPTPLAAKLSNPLRGFPLNLSPMGGQCLRLSGDKMELA